ncbi:MAG: gamma-glutamylcyclotransferase [Chromatiales bacterium]|nr:gamma-glutamylcyclotransferase [Chromatiales bacterium]
MASLFVYGTLMFPQVLRAVLGGNLAAEPARLTGYRRCALRGAWYPGIVEDRRGQVSGSVYRGINFLQLKRLDTYEGEEYRRVPVSVRLADGLDESTWVYVLRGSSRRRCLRADWDPEQFIEVRMRAYLRRMHALGVTHGPPQP